MSPDSFRLYRVVGGLPSRLEYPLYPAGNAMLRTPGVSVERAMEDKSLLQRYLRTVALAGGYFRETRRDSRGAT
jgi:hypothetical protein